MTFWIRMENGLRNLDNYDEIKIEKAWGKFKVNANNDEIKTFDTEEKAKKFIDKLSEKLNVAVFEEELEDETPMNLGESETDKNKARDEEKAKEDARQKELEEEEGK